MYRYTLEERVFIVRTYWKTESIKLCQQQFLEKFGRRHPSSKYCIWALSKKLETKGTLLDELTGGRPKMSEETIQIVKDWLQASPKKSLRRISQESGLSRSTCQRAAKKSKLHACRTSVLHELKEPDQVKRVAYCRWFQTHLKENPGILDYAWFSDEAWFHLSGYVNSQNSRIWASENPKAIHEEPLHSEKTGVWFGMSRRRIIGPVFFEETIRTDAYMEIFNTFVNRLDDEELSIGYFQQDGATSHTSHTPAWPKFSPFSATASFRRDFSHRAHPIWRRLIISYGDIWKGEFTKTNHEP